jgi:beta-mannosidase
MGHIFFNGKKLGQSDNMYVPFVADVTDIARKGSNTVTVVLENAPDEMGQIGYTSRTFTQKARFNYKWDWCTRLISVGLYRPVYVRSYQEVRFEDFYFKPVGTDGDAEFYATLHGDTKGCTVEVSIGNCLVNCPLDSRGREAKTRLHVDNVKLWYPLDVGEQNLYDLTMTIMRDGVPLKPRPCRSASVRSPLNRTTTPPWVLSATYSTATAPASMPRVSTSPPLT